MKQVGFTALLLCAFLAICTNNLAGAGIGAALLLLALIIDKLPSISKHGPAAGARYAKAGAEPVPPLPVPEHLLAPYRPRLGVELWEDA